MKKVLFSCLFGDYDFLYKFPKEQLGWTKVLYTNNKDLKSDDWDIEYVESDSDKLMSRKFKILNMFSEYDQSLYIDSTFVPIRKLDSFVSPFKSGVALNKHPRAKCAYQEAETVKQKKLDNIDVVNKQIERYRLEGFPENAGLWRCGIMVRNPGDTLNLNNIWWNEVSNNSWRDQISFPYACWKSGITPQMILPGVTTSYFKQSLHKPKPLGYFEVVNIPLNEEVNRKISSVSKQNWILVGNIPHPENHIKSNPNTHLFVTDQGLLFPRWIHDYIQIDQSNKRRWDLQFKHIVSVYDGKIIPI